MGRSNLTLTAAAAGTSLLAAAPLGGEARFRDVAAEAGLTDIMRCGRDDRKDYIIEALGGGVALLDYDRDGLLDAFFVSGSTLEGFPPGEHPSNQLYRNKGDGTFSNLTDAAGLRSEGWGQGVCAGDYDNDGFEDLFVTYLGPNRLYRNTGRGTFTEVSASAGITPGVRWSTGCAFLDYDLDGWLDLFVANYLVFDKDRIPAKGSAPSCRWKGQPVLCGPRGLPGESNQLFRNLGEGRFADVSQASGIATVTDRYSLSVTPLDFNSDGWMDVYVAVDSQASLLWENRGDGRFEDVAVFAGAALDEHGGVQAGMGSAGADLDGDGELDLIKTNFIEETSNIYLRNGPMAFEDRVHAMGAGVSIGYMGWGVGIFDYDRDTWPDILVVNGHIHPEIEPLVPGNPYRQERLLYRNLSGRRLEVVRGPGLSAAHSSRGLALGDYDNDGDVDAFVNNMNERPSLLRNDTPGGAFLSLRLVGTRSNRSAVGARVTVVAGNRNLVQEVRSGSSFLSSSDLRLHFGLGDHERADRIEIAWPYRGSLDSLHDVAAGQFIEVTEGNGLTSSHRPEGSGP